jgi:hypothetical protein
MAASPFEAISDNLDAVRLWSPDARHHLTRGPGLLCKLSTHLLMSSLSRIIRDRSALAFFECSTSSTADDSKSGLVTKLTMCLHSLTSEDFS